MKRAARATVEHLLDECVERVYADYTRAATRFRSDVALASWDRAGAAARQRPRGLLLLTHLLRLRLRLRRLRLRLLQLLRLHLLRLLRLWSALPQHRCSAGFRRRF